jgi:hypothetical protein
MSRIFLGAAIAVAVLLTSEPSWSQSAKLTKAVTLDRAEFALTPAALAFDGRGQLYVGYRDKGANKKSSAIWIRVIDPTTGKELRSVRLQTAPVTLPSGANQFKISADGSVLVYSQFQERIFVATLDSATLQKVSETTSLPEGVVQEFPKIVGIDRAGSTVLIAAQKTNRNNGTDARLLKLSARDLNRVLSDSTLTNPIPESGFAISPAGSILIVKSTGLSNTTALYSYDSSTGKAASQFSLPDSDNRSIVSLGPFSFLREDSIILASNRLLPDQTESGYLYEIRKGSSKVDAAQNVGKCRIKDITIAPDQLYGAALCEQENLGELRFGSVTSRSAVIFDTRTLKVLGQVPLQKDLYPELAIWHGDGKIVLATQASSDKLMIYELGEPKSGNESATVDPKDGNLHREISVLASAKPRQ